MFFITFLARLHEDCSFIFLSGVNGISVSIKLTKGICLKRFRSTILARLSDLSMSRTLPKSGQIKYSEAQSLVK